MEYDNLIQKNLNDNSINSLLAEKRIFFLTLLILFGSFYCYDNPYQLKPLMDDLKLELDIMRLYLYYYYPTIITTFVTGVLMDHLLGIKFGLVIFGGMTVFGQFLLGLGVGINIVWPMYLGRTIFGIGAESLAVAQNAYTAKLYKDKQLDLAFGWQIFVTRLAYYLSGAFIDLVNKSLIREHNIRVILIISLSIGCSTCLLSLLAIIMLVRMDLYTKKMDNSKFSLESTFKCCKRILVLSGICTLTYSVLVPFVNIENKFLNDSYIAANIKLIIYIAISPLIAFVTGYFGKKLTLLTIGILFLLSAHLLGAFTISLNPFIIPSFKGMAYSLIAATSWPIVPKLVTRDRLGTAYGFLQAAMNFGIIIASSSITTVSKRYGFITMEIVCLICSLFAIVVTLCLFNWDRKNNHILNSSRKKSYFPC